MTCKLDHAADLTIPQFLCRQCHPGLNQTPESNAAFYDALRASQVRENELKRLDREITTTKAKIEAMEARGRNRWGSLPIDPESVEGKIHAGLKRKHERLTHERNSKLAAYLED